MNSSIYSFLFVPYILVDVAFEMQNEKKTVDWMITVFPKTKTPCFGQKILSLEKKTPAFTSKLNTDIKLHFHSRFSGLSSFISQNGHWLYHKFYPLETEAYL